MLTQVIALCYYILQTLYQHVHEAVAWIAQLPQRTKPNTEFHLKPLPLPQTPSPPTPPTTPPLLPKSEPEPEPESEFKMSDAAKDLTGTAGNATGGRGLPDVGETMGSVTNPSGSEKGKQDKGQGKQDGGFGLDNGTDVKGSLKVHIKLDLEADIRIIARVKGDIAIGIL